MGRLVAGHLGERVDICTRMRTRDPWLHVVFESRNFTAGAMSGPTRAGRLDVRLIGFGGR